MMRNAGYTAAKSLESDLLALFVSFSTTVGTTTQALTDAVVRSAINNLETNLADFEEAAWFLAPKTIWSDLMSIDRFALALNSPGMNPVYKGAIGSVYGRPLFSTTLLTKINTNADYAGALCIPDAIHFATGNLPGQKDQYGVRLQAQYRQDYLGTLVTADILYGVIENRDLGGVRIVSAV